MSLPTSVVASMDILLIDKHISTRNVVKPFRWFIFHFLPR
jgi:hypothetical protein